EKTHQLYLRQLIDLGLGVRAIEDHSWFTPEDLQHMALAIKPGDIVELQRKDDAHNRTNIWQFDRNDRYALKKYTSTLATSELKIFEITCSEFVKEGDLALPHRVDARWYGPSTPEGQREIQRALMEDVRIELNSAENTAESFHIVWPIGTSVLHKKSGKTL